MNIKNTNIRLAAADLDGTTLCDDKTICPANIEAIREVREAGIRVVACSGRYARIMQDSLHTLGLDHEGEYYIASNGGVLMEAGKNQPVYRALPDTEALHALIELGRKHTDLVNFQIYLNGKVYVERYNNATERYEKAANAKAVIVDTLDALMDQPIEKLAFVSRVTPEEMIAFQHQIAPLVPQGIQMVRAESFLIEFISEQAGKWNTLMKLADSLGIAPDQIVTVGDRENDAQMVRCAKYGAAPLNAEDVVKEGAAYVSPYDNNHGAVADILRHFLEAE